MNDKIKNMEDIIERLDEITNDDFANSVFQKLLGISSEEIKESLFNLTKHKIVDGNLIIMFKKIGLSLSEDDIKKIEKGKGKGIKKWVKNGLI